MKFHWYNQQKEVKTDKIVDKIKTERKPKGSMPILKILLSYHVALLSCNFYKPIAHKFKLFKNWL